MQALPGHTAQQEVSVRPFVQQLGSHFGSTPTSTSLQVNRAATDGSRTALLSGSVTAWALQALVQTPL